MKVLAVSGSLRGDSYNTWLLRAAVEVAGDGVEVDVWGGLKAIPPYDQDDEQDAPAAVERLREAIAGADAVLFATPEYNHSIPGQLKNAVDWMSRPLATSPLRNKPVAVIGASTGAFGAVWAQAELRKVLRAIGARVLGVEAACANAASCFDRAGRLVDSELRERLHDVLGALAAAVDARVALAA